MLSIEEGVIYTRVSSARQVSEGNGLDSLPVPISTPGYDSAPYLTATNVTTRNPETGIQNMGTYRAGLKSSNRLAVRMVSRPGGALRAGFSWFLDGISKVQTRAEFVGFEKKRKDVR